MLKWPRDPALGGWYTDAELTAAMGVITESMDWRVGFRAKQHECEFEEAFAAYTGTRHAVAFNGAGTALDMVLECLDLAPGDEIVSCAINFVGTHVSVLRAGARLVLCEPDPATLNLDPADLIRVLTPRTRAILVTHMNGLSADMDAILQIARSHPHPVHGRPVVIGDAARACGALYKSRRVGSQGWATVFSFQSKKLMTTLGEGGMVTTDDQHLAERLARLRSFGKNRELGTNCKMTKAQAAVGLVQLARLDEMNTARIALARHRSALLAELTGASGDLAGVVIPAAPEGYRHLFYRYSLLTAPQQAGRARDEIIAVLESEYGVGCAIADPPTYRAHPLIAAHVAGQSCPVADQVGRRLLCPSLHPLMTFAEDAEIAHAVAETFRRFR